MFAKISFLTFTIPLTVFGSYYLYKNGDNFIDKNGYFFIVKAQSDGNKKISQQKNEQLYSNNKKNFRCSINEQTTTPIYDNDCKIYEMSSDDGKSSPKILDKTILSSITKITDKTKIKDNNFYVLWVNKYIFTKINNLTDIKVVNLSEFPKKHEFANFRVETPLNGEFDENKQTKTLSFTEKFKSRFLLVKITEKDNGFSWSNNLNCFIDKKLRNCDAWKLSSANKDSKFDVLQIKNPTQVTSSSHIVKDQYYILDIDTRQEEWKENDKISFSSDNSNPPQTPTNTFTIIAGILGNISTSSTNLSGQFVFVSLNDKITI